MQSSPKESQILNSFISQTLDKQEQQCRQLMAGLDKVVGDLDKQEKAIYSRVRPPLEQTRPVQDSADRLQDIKVQRLVFFSPVDIMHQSVMFLNKWIFYNMFNSNNVY